MKSTLPLVLCLLVADGSPAARQDATPEAPQERAVLVTGASSGIGRKITELLAAQGVFVYAGARSAEDLAELDALENVDSIRLDVTVPAEIAAAVETIASAGRGLHGVVNNAGVAILGPLIEVDESELSYLFDVNVFGPYRVTKAFSPLLIASKGRVVNIGSISGVLSTALMGQYSMSKHALEAYTDSLAAEMARVGVGVSIVEPGNYNSEIGKTITRHLANGSLKLEGSLFERELRGILESAGDRSRYEEPDAVAEAVRHALFDDHPLRRYMVVPDKRSAELTIKKAIEELVQLNEWQAYRYDRDALVGMLDEALAASGR